MQTIFETLRQEHDHHRELLKSLSNTDGNSPRRRELYSTLKKELLHHAAAEERVFYAALLGDSKTQPKSSHSIHEHQEMESLIDELEAMEFTNPNWIRKFSDLRDKVEHHEEEEENSIFQLAGKVLTEDQKASLTGEFERVKDGLVNAS